MKVTIYHNPRCSKSRQTLSLIEENASEIEVIPYLVNPPNADQLDKILMLLGLEPLDLIRKGERLFKSEYKDKEYTRDEWIDVLVKNPILIERPIVIKGNRAILGRPPENVRKLF